MQDHSYGDSSGITPDSLLIRPEAEPIVDANVREVLVKSKMKGERSIMEKYHCIIRMIRWVSIRCTIMRIECPYLITRRIYLKNLIFSVARNYLFNC